MTFGRWLLVNSFSIFLVTLFVLGYFYREELQLEQAYHQLMNIDAEQGVIKKPTPVEPKKATPAVTPEVKQEAIITDTVELTAAKPTIEREVDSNQQQKPLVFVEEEKRPQPISQITPGQRPNEISSKELPLNEILQLARQSYWDKRYSDAINLYQQLIQKDPANADYLGELGNIYYALNDYPNASNLYYQAAELLIAQNQKDRAQSLVPPITAMNRKLGTRLSDSLK